MQKYPAISLVSLATALSITVSSMAFAAGPATASSTDSWRASELVGLAIYGPDEKHVGQIDDVVVDKDGHMKLVVIGVGGFLGIGQKSVAVPVDQVKFSSAPAKRSVVETAFSAMAPAAVITAENSKSRTPASGRSAQPNQGKSSLDHGSITLTRDQLKSAPNFKSGS